MSGAKKQVIAGLDEMCHGLVEQFAMEKGIADRSVFDAVQGTLTALGGAAEASSNSEDAEALLKISASEGYKQGMEHLGTVLNWARVGTEIVEGAKKVQAMGEGATLSRAEELAHSAVSLSFSVSVVATGVGVPVLFALDAKANLQNAVAARRGLEIVDKKIKQLSDKVSEFVDLLTKDAQRLEELQIKLGTIKEAVQAHKNTEIQAFVHGNKLGYPSEWDKALESGVYDGLPGTLHAYCDAYREASAKKKEFTQEREALKDGIYAIMQAARIHHNLKSMITDLERSAALNTGGAVAGTAALLGAGNVGTTATMLAVGVGQMSLVAKGAASRGAAGLKRRYAKWMDGDEGVVKLQASKYFGRVTGVIGQDVSAKIVGALHTANGVLADADTRVERSARVGVRAQRGADLESRLLFREVLVHRYKSVLDNAQDLDPDIEMALDEAQDAHLQEQAGLVKAAESLSKAEESYNASTAQAKTARNAKEGMDRVFSEGLEGKSEAFKAVMAQARQHANAHDSIAQTNLEKTKAAVEHAQKAVTKRHMALKSAIFNGQLQVVDQRFVSAAEQFEQVQQEIERLQDRLQELRANDATKQSVDIADIAKKVAEQLEVQFRLATSISEKIVSIAAEKKGIIEHHYTRPVDGKLTHMADVAALASEKEKALSVVNEQLIEAEETLEDVNAGIEAARQELQGAMKDSFLATRQGFETGITPAGPGEAGRLARSRAVDRHTMQRPGDRKAAFEAKRAQVEAAASGDTESGLAPPPRPVSTVFANAPSVGDLARQLEAERGQQVSGSGKARTTPTLNRPGSTAKPSASSGKTGEWGPPGRKLSDGGPGANQENENTGHSM